MDRQSVPGSSNLDIGAQLYLMLMFLDVRAGFCADGILCCFMGHAGGLVRASLARPQFEYVELPRAGVRNEEHVRHLLRSVGHETFRV